MRACDSDRDDIAFGVERKRGKVMMMMEKKSLEKRYDFAFHSYEST